MSRIESSSDLSLSSTRSSTRSNMRIDMPAQQTDFSTISASQPRVQTPYVIASLPSPTQNPHKTSWSHAGVHHHIHIPTPHPVSTTASFLDKHVPMFSKHHHEFAFNHDARAARREARKSLQHTAIPEVDMEHLPGGSVGAALHAVTATAAAPALADSKIEEERAWQEIIAKREAARLRSGSDGANRRRSLDTERSDSEAKSSPAVTP
ncbi:hypothetical protein B0A52_00843 [Exophiala mesophila]|uniref:Uncharacterized protein n=1 Tax=Exophiala mesophila TaxID=212818 RepID=A0A438NIE5_EXOME|nr:hypothetical protein B0A52_00843 [Exophiala mesophila]